MTVTRQALRVYATLEGLKPKNEADVLDALIPFLSPLLDLLDGKVFETGLLIAGLHKLYGWKISTEVALVFQERLEAHGLLVKPDPKARIWLVQARSAEADEGASFAQDMRQVVEAFQQFAQSLNDLLHRDRSDEDALDLLVKFLVTLDVSSQGKRDANGDKYSELLKTLAPEDTHLHADERYLAARFVDQVSKTDEELFGKLTKLAAVGMLTEVVQDFVEPSQNGEQSKLTIVLDAPLALAALGVSGTEAQRDVSLNIDAARQIGCSVVVLEESCDEMSRILKTTLATPRQNRHGPTHSAIVKGQVREQFVEIVQRDPERALRAIGVTVRQLTLAGTPSQHVHFTEALFQDFQAAINWRQGFPDAIRHDATVMTLVCRLREGHRAVDIFDNRFVFITNNGAFVRLARQFSLECGIVQERHCPPVIQHASFAVAAWLRTGFGAQSDIPTAHLLAHCERVLNVRKEVVQRARELLRTITPEQEAQYDLLLQDARSVTKLMDFTLGDEERLTEATIPTLLAEMKRATVSELKEEHEKAVAAQRRKHAEERKQAAAIQAQLAGEVRNLQSRLDANEAQQQAKLSRLQSSINAVVAEANRRMTSVRYFTTLIASVIALLLLLNAVFGWVNWQADQPVLYAAGTGLGLYGALQQFISWPSFGFGSVLNWVGKVRLRRALERRGLIADVDESEFSWSYGQADRAPIGTSQTT
ncbi:hypothetical protein [Tianweitania sediminis]|uniref:Uncharacterized protein n=1 Tax=Tianweitania sediminis TaxID=1502156 RepID=A0A8J7UJF2_9HYPH|nr:hypothetical protein [Tianweitania sediminis]MBP0439983.1 hypothetical protein [Tianweitania sediminis]